MSGPPNRRRGTPLRGSRSRTLAVGEAPSRSAKPAPLLANLLVAIEARDLFPTLPGEGLGKIGVAE